eukprot:1885207-Alexandrium_andersonii.AAC.1
MCIRDSPGNVQPLQNPALVPKEIADFILSQARVGRWKGMGKASTSTDSVTPGPKGGVAPSASASGDGSAD